MSVETNWDLVLEQLHYKLNILEFKLWEREREREREINQRFTEPMKSSSEQPDYINNKICVQYTSWFITLHIA